MESESGGGIRAWRETKGATVVWRLQYAELTDAEALALEQFYLARGGRMESFTFADPITNVLLQSENPAGAAWQGSGSGVSLQGAERDGHRVLTAQTGSRLQQSVEVAAGIYYCASAWAKGSAGARFQIDLAGYSSEFILADSWKRCAVSMAPAGTDGVVQAVFENTGPGPVEIAGLCVQAQAYAGESRMSGTGRSLYREAKFSDGGFRCVPVGPDRNRVTVTIEAVIEDEA